MTASNAEITDEIVTELSSYSLDRLPQVKKKWIHEINCSDLPFSVKVKAIYFAGTACDLVMQEKNKRHNDLP